jgi:dihydrofolate reductase
MALAQVRGRIVTIRSAFAASSCMVGFRKTAVFRNMLHLAGGGEGIDNDFAARSFENAGAWILGRNMFGPIRGPWIDDSWKGWWGEEPPYHVPVFVLSHHARAPLPMKGNTTFYFVADGAESALQQAKVCGKRPGRAYRRGVSTIRQYLTAGLIDEMHLAFSPVLLGEGEIFSPGLTCRSFCSNRCNPLRGKRRLTSS